MIFMIKISLSKKAELYHACVLKYVAAKKRSFLKNRLYFGHPLYTCDVHSTVYTFLELLTNTISDGTKMRCQPQHQ
jgi:hypothetical protein